LFQSRIDDPAIRYKDGGLNFLVLLAAERTALAAEAP
jgi:hypothetical protein